MRQLRVGFLNRVAVNSVCYQNRNVPRLDAAIALGSVRTAPYISMRSAVLRLRQQDDVVHERMNNFCWFFEC